MSLLLLLLLSFRSSCRFSLRVGQSFNHNDNVVVAVAVVVVAVVVVAVVVVVVVAVIAVVAVVD